MNSELAVHYQQNERLVAKLLSETLTVAVVGVQADFLTGKIKWKKLAKRAIIMAGAKLKVKKLQKQLLREAEVPMSQHPIALEQLMVAINSSKQFCIVGSSITLNEPRS